MTTDETHNLREVRAAGRLGPSRPEWSLLEEFAPRKVWDAAFRRAEKAPMQKFRMGAVIMDRKGQIQASGCSHISEHNLTEVATTHAERHALQRGSHLNLQGCSVVVASLNRQGTGCPWSSCPCRSCAQALFNRGVEWVIYPQRQADGSWSVRRERPQDLLNRSRSADPDENPQFARQQRVCEVAA